MLFAQSTLASLVEPHQDEVVTLGDNVEGVVAAWEIATKEERHDMLHMMLDAVYVDMKTKEVVGLKPKSAFYLCLTLESRLKPGNLCLRQN